MSPQRRASAICVRIEKVPSDNAAYAGSQNVSDGR